MRRVWSESVLVLGRMLRRLSQLRCNRKTICISPCAVSVSVHVCLSVCLSLYERMSVCQGVYVLTAEPTSVGIVFRPLHWAATHHRRCQGRVCSATACRSLRSPVADRHGPAAGACLRWSVRLPSRRPVPIRPVKPLGGRRTVKGPPMASPDWPPPTPAVSGPAEVL